MMCFKLTNLWIVCVRHLSVDMKYAMSNLTLSLSLSSSGSLLNAFAIGAYDTALKPEDSAAHSLVNSDIVCCAGHCGRGRRHCSYALSQLQQSIFQRSFFFPRFCRQTWCTPCILASPLLFCCHLWPSHGVGFAIKIDQPILKHLVRHSLHAGPPFVLCFTFYIHQAIKVTPSIDRP